MKHFKPTSGGLVYGKRSTRTEVEAVEQTAWTDTWHPITHRQCIASFDTALDTLGLKKLKETYSMSNGGGQAYGMIIVQDGNNGVDIKNTPLKTIVWRNSVDKSVSFGMTSATTIFQCENLALFSSFNEVSAFRKHTKRLDGNTLNEIVANNVRHFTEKASRDINYHRSFADVPLSDDRVRRLAYDAITRGVISRRKISEFNRILFSASREYNPSNLYGFHGACTQTMREMRMTGSFVDKQKELSKMVVEAKSQHEIYDNVRHFTEKASRDINYHRSFADVPLSDDKVRRLAYDAITRGVISRRKISEFNRILFSASREYNPSNLYGFHGACTQTMREMRMTGSFVDKQKELSKMVVEAKSQHEIYDNVTVEV